MQENSKNIKFSCACDKAMSASAFPSPSACPLFQPGHCLTFFTFSISRLHPSTPSIPPPPLVSFLLSFCPFYTDFPSLPTTPHPPVPGPMGTVCCAREEFSQLFLLPEDVAIKKSSHFPYALSYPWTRDREKDEEERGKAIACVSSSL